MGFSLWVNVCMHIREHMCTYASVVRAGVFWDQGFCSGHAKFEVPARHPRGDVGQTIGYLQLELREVD